MNKALNELSKQITESSPYKMQLGKGSRPISNQKQKLIQIGIRNAHCGFYQSTNHSGLRQYTEL